MAIKSKGKQLPLTKVDKETVISTSESNRSAHKKVSRLFQQEGYPPSRAQGNRTLNKTKYNL